jgi:2-aminoadipate transaminase
MNPSVLREILKLAERPGIVSLAGGLPSADLFPIEALREATARVLAESPREALQYAASEGFGPLREWIAADCARRGMRHVRAADVLVTTGSQQGLDLVAKAFIDAGSTVAVERPSYLGALQAFSVFEPRLVGLDEDEAGVRPESLRAHAAEARFLYLLPNFRNPTGSTMTAARRDAIADAAMAAGVPIVEDDPYGDLWYDAPPPDAIAARWPEGTVHLGSFSKVLAPGLRLGYLVAPQAAFPKLLQAKQAADLHTPGFNQRIVHALVESGLLEGHVPALRAHYRVHRDAMRAALERHLPNAEGGCRWRAPAGGMFFWVELPRGTDAERLLALSIERGVAFVPGGAFHVGEGVDAEAGRATLRLSFVTVAPEAIERGVAAIAAALRDLLAGRP